MTYRLEDLPADERTALTAIVEAVEENREAAIVRYLELRKRKRRKARADAARDLQKRVLVGARVPREEAWLIARAADLQGLSLYAYCRQTLLTAAREAVSPPGTD